MQQSQELQRLINTWCDAESTRAKFTEVVKAIQHMEQTLLELRAAQGIADEETEKLYGTVGRVLEAAAAYFPASEKWDDPLVVYAFRRALDDLRNAFDPTKQER